MIVSRRLIVLASVLTAFSSTALAEERGRLPDGRAYRVDDQGNEIVDYIAELEMEMEGLRRRVHGLEDELQEKQRRLDQGGARQGPPVSERTLVAPVFDRPQQSNQVQREAQPARSCVVEVNAAVAEEREKGAKRELELDQQRALCLQEREQALTELQLSRQQQSADVALESAKAQQEISRLTAELRTAQRAAQSKEDLIAALQREPQRDERGDRERVELQARVAALEDQLDQSRRSERESVAALQQELSDRVEEMETLKARIVAVEEERDRKIGALTAQLEQRRGEQAEASRASLAVVRTSPAQERAMAALKGRVRSQLSMAKSMLATRQSLHSRYLKSPRNVEISLQAAESERGLDLNAVQRELAEAGSAGEIARLQRDAQQIQIALQEDIGLLKRVLHIR